VRVFQDDRIPTVEVKLILKKREESKYKENERSEYQELRNKLEEYLLVIKKELRLKRL
jgi:hypothetical protein